MAGLKHCKMAFDPAIIRLANVTTNRYKYFRWTPYTAGVAFRFLVLFPGLLGYVAYATEGKYNFRAKRRGDLILEY